MRSATRPVLFGLVLALLLMGCSGDDGSTDDGTEGAASDNASTESDDGSGNEDDPSSGAAADLGDFPVPAPPVGEAALTTEAEGTTIYTITFPGSDFETVVDFYDDWTSSQGEEYQRTEAASGGVTWLATSGDRIRVIVAAGPTESDDRGFVTLSDGPAG